MRQAGPDPKPKADVSERQRLREALDAGQGFKPFRSAEAYDQQRRQVSLAN
jgi:hypothetical protein